MLVNCVAYQNGKKLGDIPVEDISEYVSRPDCFVWVALKDPTSDELNQMAEEFTLHPLAVEDARKGHQRPKIEEYHDSLFAVVHTVEQAPEGMEAPLRVGEVAMFVGPNYLMSVRHRTEKGFFYALLDTIVDRYFPILDALETELESIEEQIFVRNSARSNIEALYALKRQLMVLNHAVDPMIEAIGKLYGGRVPQVCVGLQDYFRDVYDHLLRIHASIGGIREMLTTAIQVNLGMINLNETEVTKKLAGWAALIAIPTLIAGIYGMNFKIMPELEWPHGYLYSLGLMVAVDVALFAWFRRIRWL